MMWKIYKDDGQDLSFAISCLYYDAINMNEFNQWIEEVIRTTKIEDIPDYIFSLLENQDIYNIYNIIGFVPDGYLDSNKKDSLFGIALFRGTKLYDMNVSENYALALLKENPEILKIFHRIFPLISLQQLG